MTDLRLTANEWATAREVCTQKQITALDLWRRGAGSKRISLVMGIDPSTARAHVKAGRRRLTDALEQAEAA